MKEGASRLAKYSVPRTIATRELKETVSSVVSEVGKLALEVKSVSAGSKSRTSHYAPAYVGIILGSGSHIIREGG
ncbi:hypothetical protein WG66_008587 [Moniliophthora roreri]|nr:hypothetical protein WG66_008587 [Moniliophthora roreri]